MTGPVNDWMDLRCIDANYKDDLLTALTGVLTQGAGALEEAANNINDFLAAQEEGRDTYHGREVAVQVALYQDLINTLPDQLHRLARIFDLVDKAPTCEEATWQRVAARIKSEIPSKVKGSQRWQPTGYGGDEPEWDEEFDLGPLEQDIIDFED